MTPGPVSEGVHKVVVSGKGLDNASSTADASPIVTSTSNNGLSQQWRFTQRPDDSYTLTNQQSGLCLDVSGGSTSAGATVVQATCTGSSSQRWHADRRLGGVFILTSVKSGLALTATSTAVNGSPVTQEVSNGGIRQRWVISS